MLGHLLGNNRSVVLDSFRQKITGKEDAYKDRLSQALTNYVDDADPYLIVIPNAVGENFTHALVQALNEALQKENIDYVPATNYRKAAETLTKWRDQQSANYTDFAKRLPNQSPDTFIRLLNDTDVTAYRQFKQYFHEIIGVEFAENYANDAYPVFVETAKYIATKNYRGIVILCDEFGGMLNQLVNRPEGTGLVVQNFIENIKRTDTGVNILFIAASHQDPATLREDKQQDVTKVVGRFVSHLLAVAESEAEEILSLVFLHPDSTGFTALPLDNYLAEASLRVMKHNLYPGKADAWVTEKLLKNLYPLHPLSSYLLSRLSTEFAQSNRSMFNFLSPVETKPGALSPFLETTEIQTPDGQLNLFTPDRLLTFFEKNLAESKQDSIVNLLDSYRTVLHKLVDEPETEQIFRNLLMFTIVGGRLQPKKDILFWAMNWPAGQRADFDNLLNDLATRELLIRNFTTDVYEFPASGSKSVFKIIHEEKEKLTGLPLSECAMIWERLEPRPNVHASDQEEAYGANRYVRAVVARRIVDMNSPVENLTRYYRGVTDDYPGNGLLFYLLAPTQAERQPMLDALQQPSLTQPYTFYAVPKDGAMFESVQTQTIAYCALEQTLSRDEVKANPNQLRNVQEQRRLEESRLKAAIRKVYEPTEWEWHYGVEISPQAFKSPRSFSDWFNTKVNELFMEGSVPVVREDVLWFRDSEKPARTKALEMLWDADKDGLQLNSGSTKKKNAQERILENFLRNLKMTKDGRNVSGTQFGDLKNPDSNTPAGAIFKYMDKALVKGGASVMPAELLAGLLQKPFGLSRPLTLFILTAYARLNRDELIVNDAKRSQPQPASADLFEAVMRRPQDYRLRRIDLSGPQKRYLDRLRDLFDDKSARSFTEVGKQITGMVSFLTPLQRELIRQDSNRKQADFYESLYEFTKKMTASGANQDTEAKAYLLDTLPGSLLGLTPAQFDDDSSASIPRLIDLIRQFKDFPKQKEIEFRLDTLTQMASIVFGETLVSKDDIRKITEDWFRQLAPAKRNAIHEQPKLNDWLNIIKNGPGRNKDLFDTYLSELSQYPDKDWTGNLSQCQSRYIDEFKAYRKTVEDYTQSPLPVYQTIARVMFEVSKNDCLDETRFATLFGDWYAGLSNQVKAHSFDDKAVQILLDNVSSGLSTKQKFLEFMPTRWRDIGQLPSYMPAQWEDWSDLHHRAVAEEYRRCYQLINDWKPAVSEADYFGQIGQVFGLNNTKTAEDLRQALVDQWVSGLPERTRSASWASVKSIDAQFMAHLSGSDFADFMTRILPAHYDFPTLQTVDDDVLLALTRKLEGIRTKVEAYRRPLTEVIGILEKKPYDSVAEYQNTLYAILRNTEACENRADKDDTLPLGHIPRLLLQQVRQNTNFDIVVEVLAGQFGLPEDHHAWSKEQQLIFIRNTKEQVAALRDWRFPEDRRMADAKAELSRTIWKACQDYGLSAVQMRKLVNDILGEQPQNGQA